VSEARPPPERTAVSAPRRWTGLSDNPVARGVSRLPANVHTKLLIAFVGTAALAVAVGILGLRVLGQSNDRAERVGALQERALAYGSLQSDTRSIRRLLNENPGPDFYEVNPEIRPKGREISDVAIDQAVLNSLVRLRPSTNADILGFTPPMADRAVLRQIREKSERLESIMARIIEMSIDGVSDNEQKPLRVKAHRLAQDLFQTAADLASATTVATEALIAENEHSYASQRNRFIGVAVAAMVLALLLGLVLAWSVIGPIQRIDARLAAIAAGDFSGRVDVSNRDELGALAANVNRMNDELDRLYRELETASAHKSEFLASMSHELRTPLNAIIGFSQVLRERMFGELNEKQEEYLDDILASAYHLLSLINDVLDLSKVEAGQIELELTPFSLRDALESGVVMVRERASEDGVQVELSADPEIDPVEGDERRIRQVVFNLLANAVKFTPEGGSVDVSAARVNGEVRVSVADTGPGVAPEDRERIFEEFQQTDVGVGLGEGTGLGLALSKRFVELHGGRIWVESDVGAGSTFVFTLPAGAEADAG
jgi:signal transduction histidine kinase